MLRKEWTIDSQLTSKINIPGLTIVDNVETDADYYGIYQFEDMPHCSCGCAGHFDGFYKPVTIWHILDDDQLGRADHPKIISIEIQKRRYRCSGCSKIIPYKQDVTLNGASTTSELNNYIGRQCLDRSPQKVADDVGLKKSTVANISNRWAAEQLDAYENTLIAPKEIGLHIITVKDVQYCLITDIANCLIVDIFEENDFTGVMTRLAKLAYTQDTSDVLTEIDRLHIVAVRGIFRDDAVIRAAVASICRILAADIISEMNQRYTGRGKKAISTWLSTPMFEDLPIEPEVNRILRQGSDGPHGWLYLPLSAYRFFRKIASQSWDAQHYRDWIYGIKLWSFTPEQFSDALDFATDELDNSFQNPDAQLDYIDTEWWATKVILQNQKCSFDLLRKRLLLTCPPQIAGHKTDVGTKYYYRGISLAQLSVSLKEYED